MKKIGVLTLFVFSLVLAVVVLTGQLARADAPLKTVTGTVVSIQDEILTIQTMSGTMSFDLDKTTEQPAGGIAVNNQITVWYDSDDDPADEPDARKITMAPTTPSAPAPAKTETRSIDLTEEVKQEEPMPQQERTELPETAGPLPLLAGAGVLALAGGALLRKLSRRA